MSQRRRREGDSAGRSARHNMVSVIVVKYSSTSMDVHHSHPHPLHLLTKDGSHECLSQADSACSTLSPTIVIVLITLIVPTQSTSSYTSSPLHLLTKDGSHECLSQADSACSTLSPTAAALMEHHMMENNLDQVVRQPVRKSQQVGLPEVGLPDIYRYIR